MASLDLDLVRHALATARSNGFAEVEVGIGEERFVARLASHHAPAPAAGLPSTAASESSLAAIAAPLVGYYRESAVPLRPGVVISAGEVVGVIAALGIANEVESKVSGEVQEVLVEAGQPVQYGQVIATVKPQ